MIYELWKTELDLHTDSGQWIAYELFQIYDAPDWEPEGMRALRVRALANTTALQRFMMAPKVIGISWSGSEIIDRFQAPRPLRLTDMFNDQITQLFIKLKQENTDELQPQ